MDEIFRISDDITVYRDGEYIASDRAENLNVDKLIQLMVGREVSNMFPKVDCPIGDTILKVENLSAGHAVKNVSFELHRGEILGMAGLVGAGRTETAEAIFGMRHITGGKIYKDGKELHIKSPEHAIAHKIALLTEDRRGNGIVGMLSIQGQYRAGQPEKLRIPAQSQEDARGHRRIRAKAQHQNADDRHPHSRTCPAAISRRCWLGRWLLTDPGHPDRRRADPRY